MINIFIAAGFLFSSILFFYFIYTNIFFKIIMFLIVFIEQQPTLSYSHIHLHTKLYTLNNESFVFIRKSLSSFFFFLLDLPNQKQGLCSLPRLGFYEKMKKKSINQILSKIKIKLMETKNCPNPLHFFSLSFFLLNNKLQKKIKKKNIRFFLNIYIYFYLFSFFHLFYFIHINF